MSYPSRHWEEISIEKEKAKKRIMEIEEKNKIKKEQERLEKEKTSLKEKEEQFEISQRKKRATSIIIENEPKVKPGQLSGIDWDAFEGKLKTAEVKQAKANYVPKSPSEIIKEEKQSIIDYFEKSPQLLMFETFNREKVEKFCKEFFTKEKEINIKKDHNVEILINGRRINYIQYMTHYSLSTYDEFIKQNLAYTPNFVNEKKDLAMKKSKPEINKELIEEVKREYEQKNVAYLTEKLKEIREDEREKAREEAPGRSKKIVYVDVEKEVIKEKIVIQYKYIDSPEKRLADIRKNLEETLRRNLMKKEVKPKIVFNELMARLALLPIRELGRDWTNLAYEIINSTEFVNPISDSLKNFRKFLLNSLNKDWTVNRIKSIITQARFKFDHHKTKRVDYIEKIVEDDNNSIARGMKIITHHKRELRKLIETADKNKEKLKKGWYFLGRNKVQKHNNTKNRHNGNVYLYLNEVTMRSILYMLGKYRPKDYNGQKKHWINCYDIYDNLTPVNLFQNLKDKISFLTIKSREYLIETKQIFWRQYNIGD
jgi:hypothetical protein